MPRPQLIGRPAHNLEGGGGILPRLPAARRRRPQSTAPVSAAAFSAPEEPEEQAAEEEDQRWRAASAHRSRQLARHTVACTNERTSALAYATALDPRSDDGWSHLPPSLAQLCGAFDALRAAPAHDAGAADRADLALTRGWSQLLSNRDLPPPPPWAADLLRLHIEVCRRHALARDSAIATARAQATHEAQADVDARVEARLLEMLGDEAKRQAQEDDAEEDANENEGAEGIAMLRQASSAFRRAAAAVMPISRRRQSAGEVAVAEARNAGPAGAPGGGVMSSIYFAQTLRRLARQRKRRQQDRDAEAKRVAEEKDAQKAAWKQALTREHREAISGVAPSGADGVLNQLYKDMLLRADH